MPPQKRTQAAPRGSGKLRTHTKRLPEASQSKPVPAVNGVAGGKTAMPPTTSGPAKRKPTEVDDGGDDGSARVAKRTKVNRGQTTSSRRAAKPGRAALSKVHATSEPPTPAQVPTLNQVPTSVLSVLVFGNGDAGELGLGPARNEAKRPCPNSFVGPSSSLRVVQLDCGGMHTVALTSDNKIVTWGVNDNGALGRSTDWDGGLRDIDGDSDDEGDGLNPFESTPTPIPAHHFDPDARFVQVAAGDSCSFALTDSGLVYGWGTFKNTEGNGRFCRGREIVDKQTTPTRVQGLSNITKVVCGANHALALDAHGTVRSWGCGEQNQLGRRLFGNSDETLALSPQSIGIRDVKCIGSGEYHSFAVDKKDNVWAWGLNSFGEAGYAKTAGDEAVLPYPMKIRGLRGQGVVHIDGGAHHSAAVTASGQCLVWGRLDGGQLGISFSAGQLEDGSLIRRDDRDKPRICLRPTAVPDTGPVSHIACGTEHTILITTAGGAYSSGFNSLGQLGLGHEDDVNVFQRVKLRPEKDQPARERLLTWAGAGGQFSMIAGCF